MKASTILLFFMCIFALIFIVPGYADDTELYVNYDKDLAEKTRVLFVLDTSGSMLRSAETGLQCRDPYTSFLLECPDSRINAARNVITRVINSNPDMDFGLFRFSANEGGYLKAKLGTDHKTIKNIISNISAGGSTPVTETLWETYRYLTGQSVDFAKLIDPSMRDTTAEKDQQYVSPFSSPNKRCDNTVNIILISDGEPQWDNSRDAYIQNIYRNYFGTTAPSYPVNDYEPDSHLAALAKIIHGTKNVKVDLYTKTSSVNDQGVIYTVGFGSGITDNNEALLTKTAEFGGGQYLFANNAKGLSEAIDKAFAVIREDSGDFTAPAITSNNRDQTRSRDALYYTMFYPSTNARWRGNLKKLKVSGDSIVDATGKSALNTQGLIAKNARTFWLPDEESPDGNSVELGGVNLYLSSISSLPKGGRKVLSNLSGRMLNFTRYRVVYHYKTIAKAAAVFEAKPEEVEDLINWSRGLDVDDENNDYSTSDSRKDIFGDPLHSRPVTIDYGNDDVRILIGTNAGYLHMFQDKNDVLSESWAFIPRHLYKIIKPLRDNQRNNKVYGIDGPISVFFDDKNKDGIVGKGDRVWAFFGLRRGGNNYYGLDITKPDSPKVLWGGPIVGGSGDFQELAQTWSKAQVAYINLRGYKDRPVLIFGAGYDTNKDNRQRSSDSKGRGIYIVDAETGKKIWALTPSQNGFQGKHSIASDIALVDSDYDGYIDRLYASDTGGDIWRIDMATDNSNNWTHFKLASLGGTYASTDRRFFYKPTIARSVYSKVSEVVVNGKSTITRLDTPFDAVLIGSGNRAKPTLTSVKDQLFMIRDINTVTKSFTGNNVPTTITHSDLMNVSSDPFAKQLDDIKGFVNLEVELSRFHGWYYNLPIKGEKSLAASTVVGGVAYFTSFSPGSTSNITDQCSLSGGSGGLYAFHLHYGTKVYDELKYETGNDVPDTPQLFFGENDKGESQFMLIGTGIIGEKAPFVAKGVLGPGLNIENGKVKLVSNDRLGFEVQQTYIYKQERLDQSQ